jgi:hypothetical protein
MMPRPLYFMVNLIMGGYNFEHVHTRVVVVFSGLRIRIRFILGSWIRIREKSWIQTRMKVKIQEP